MERLCHTVSLCNMIDIVSRIVTTENITISLKTASNIQVYNLRYYSYIYKALNCFVIVKLHTQ